MAGRPKVQDQRLATTPGLPADDEIYLTKPEVAAILRISVRQIDYLKERGELGYTRLSTQRVVYRTGDVRAFLARNRIEARPGPA